MKGSRVLSQHVLSKRKRKPIASVAIAGFAVSIAVAACGERFETASARQGDEAVGWLDNISDAGRDETLKSACAAALSREQALTQSAPTPLFLERNESLPQAYGACSANCIDVLREASTPIVLDVSAGDAKEMRNERARLTANAPYAPFDNPGVWLLSKAKRETCSSEHRASNAGWLAPYVDVCVVVEKMAAIPRQATRYRVERQERAYSWGRIVVTNGELLNQGRTLARRYDVQAFETNSMRLPAMCSDEMAVSLVVRTLSVR